jgi:hypothetical protein
MAFRQGRFAEITLSGVALTTYADSIDLSEDVEMLETTTFTAVSKTYLPGLSDAKIDIKGKYDPTATNGPVAVLRSLKGASNAVPFQYFPGGNTAGQIKIYGDAYLVSFKNSSEVGGVVIFEASLQATGPVVASGI